MFFGFLVVSCFESSRDGLTRREEIPDPVVALRERVEDPPAAGEEPLIVQVVVVGQRPETVHPQAHALHLGWLLRLTIGVSYSSQTLTRVRFYESFTSK